MPPKFLDSHIHLWPSNATSPQNHAWMTPGHFLAKRHGPSDYLSVANPKPNGFVYVETDRYLPTPSPGPTSTEEELKQWAKEPLEEIRFLRRIAEERAEEGDGISAEKPEGDLMKGCVIWAPFHLIPPVFQKYIHMAEEAAGPQLWKKVVGFRYLLQGKPAGEVVELLSSEDFVRNIVGLERRFSFDVGVDVHRDGDGSLEVLRGMVREIRRSEGEGRKFVLSKFFGHLSTRIIGVLRLSTNKRGPDHLCKPNFSHQPSPAWLAALQSLGQDEDVYMKLSGAFNEFDRTPESIDDILTAVCFPRFFSIPYSSSK